MNSVVGYSTGAHRQLSLINNEKTLTKGLRMKNKVLVYSVVFFALGIIRGHAISRVNDLRGQSVNTTITLTWTVPVGTTTYDLRIGTAQINTVNWDSQQRVTPAPAPGPAGTVQTFLVPTVLATNTYYYFAIKVQDGGGIWSAQSNQIRVKTGEESTVILTEVLLPPERIRDLKGGVSGTIVMLTWTVPVGVVAYDIRVGTTQISALNWTNQTRIASPVPTAAGTLQTFSFTSGLAPNTYYYFAIKVQGTNGVWSTQSNQIRVRTDNGVSPVTLAWDANTDQATRGYYFYVEADSVIVGRTDVGNVTSATINSLVTGQTYVFYVTAYDNRNQESSPSNKITYEAGKPTARITQPPMGPFLITPEVDLQTEFPGSFSWVFGGFASKAHLAFATKGTLPDVAYVFDPKASSIVVSQDEWQVVRRALDPGETTNEFYWTLVDADENTFLELDASTWRRFYSS